MAFQAKMIEAWMVLPALGLAYLLARPGPAGRRIGQLVIAGVVAGLVSVSWMTAVSLVPAADRPYVDGSHDDSIFEQVFSYKGSGGSVTRPPLQLLAAARSGISGAETAGGHRGQVRRAAQAKVIPSGVGCPGPKPCRS